MITKNDLKKLKENLPRGYGKNLSKLTGKSESAVYQTLSGKIESLNILNEAVKLAKVHEQRNREMASYIQSL